MACVCLVLNSALLAHSHRSWRRCFELAPRSLALLVALSLSLKLKLSLCLWLSRTLSLTAVVVLWPCVALRVANQFAVCVVIVIIRKLLKTFIIFKMSKILISLKFCSVHG